MKVGMCPAPGIGLKDLKFKNMKEKKYTKIKVKDTYGTTIIKKIPEDPNIHEMMLVWRDVLLGLGYSAENINEYIKAD